MPPPLGFTRSCVPQAVARLLGRPVEEIAGLLWPLRSLWWPEGLVAGSTEGWGTPPAAVPDLLVRMGGAVERWDGDGVLRVSTKWSARTPRDR